MTTSESAVRRYRDAYNVARTVNSVSLFVRALSIAMGIVLFIVFCFVAGTAASDSARLTGGAANNGLDGVIALLNTLWTFLRWPLIGYIAGVCIAAYGQMLRIQTDCAVHGSPFMDDPTKASVMNLPDLPL